MPTAGECRWVPKVGGRGLWIQLCVEFRVSSIDCCSGIVSLGTDDYMFCPHKYVSEYCRRKKQTYILDGFENHGYFEQILNSAEAI